MVTQNSFPAHQARQPETPALWFWAEEATLFRFLIFIPIVSLLTACPEECKSDLQCPDVTQSCQDGLCASLPNPEVVSCTGDGDCQEGRRCVDESCAYAPSCLRFTAAPRAKLEATCGEVISTGDVQLRSHDCQTSVQMDEAEVTIGAFRTDGRLEGATCTGSFDYRTDMMRIEGECVSDCTVLIAVDGTSTPCTSQSACECVLIAGTDFGYCS